MLLTIVTDHRAPSSTLFANPSRKPYEGNETDKRHLYPKIQLEVQEDGHVFLGRYKAIIVDKDSYLLELCRYVVFNPFGPIGERNRKHGSGAVMALRQEWLR
jgi:hypothetical protein